ncbi:MAG TPA: PD-(D/E)XK nuclease family protein, partial [Verrucomicrobiae bacterium]|nr:PD-(D/E)XK nuclease family protein [Verrucomicrobiae bacterium]
MSETLHILPSAAAVETHLSRTLAERGILLGREALTLRGLVDELYAACGPSADTPSPVGLRLLLERLVISRRASLQLLAPLQRFPGFISCLESCFAELEEALVAPEEFAVILRRMPPNPRLREIALLYGEWRGLLAEKSLANAHDRGVAALQGLRAGMPLPPLLASAGRMAVVGIYDLTPLQRALLAELSLRLPVEVRLPYDFGATPAFAAVARTASRFEAMERFPLELSFDEPAGRFARPLVGGGPEPVELITAPGSYQECEEIGRRIRSLMEGGCDPRRIGVLFRDLREYGAIMEDVCRRFRIPLSSRRGAPLSSSPLVATLLAPLELAVSGFGREELLRLLKSTYGSFLPEGVEADLVERVLLAAGYRKGGERSLEDALGAHITRLRRRGKDAAGERGVLAALRPLLKELRPFGRRLPLRESTRLLESFIGRYGIFRRGIEGADPRVVKRDASAIARFRLLLDDLERDLVLLGIREEEFEPAEFLLLLRLGMEGVTLDGERGSGVSVMTLHDARGLSFDHVFIGGLSDDQMPPRHPPLALFGDEEKLRFREAGGSFLKTAADRLLEEPLLLRLAADAAVESLTFSWPCADRRGNRRLRSFLLEELLPSYRVTEHQVPLERIAPPAEECLEPEELMNSLALAGRVEAASALGGEHVALARLVAENTAVELAREAFAQEEDAARRALLSSPHTGSLASAEAAAALQRRHQGEALRLSATALEEYAGCPFRYFARRLLGLAPVEETEQGLEAREEGSLLHEILEAFYRRMDAEGRLPLRGLPEEREAAEQAAAEVFLRWEREERTGEPLLWESSRAKLVELACALVEAEGSEQSPLRPVAFEHRFDGIRVQEGEGSIVLHGVVDRIDASPDGTALQVVDYKLGGDQRRYRELLKEENLGRLS